MSLKRREQRFVWYKEVFRAKIRQERSEESSYPIEIQMLIRNQLIQIRKFIELYDRNVVTPLIQQLLQRIHVIISQMMPIRVSSSRDIVVVNIFSLRYHYSIIKLTNEGDVTIEQDIPKTYSFDQNADFICNFVAELHNTPMCMGQAFVRHGKHSKKATGGGENHHQKGSRKGAQGSVYRIGPPAAGQ